MSNLDDVKRKLYQLMVHFIDYPSSTTDAPIKALVAKYSGLIGPDIPEFDIIHNYEAVSNGHLDVIKRAYVRYLVATIGPARYNWQMNLLKDD